MNTHINKNHPEQKWERKFLGKVKDFKDKEEGKFESKHLKAYIQGKEEFQYGFIETPQGRKPNMIQVKQQLIKL